MVTSRVDAILYILRMHIACQTTPCVLSSNMRTRHLAASPGIKLACNKLALALLFISGWPNAVDQASIYSLMLCIKHQYSSSS